MARKQTTTDATKTGMAHRQPWSQTSCSSRWRQCMVW